MRQLALKVLILVVLLAYQHGKALAPVDLSAIGDFRTFTHNIEGSPKKNNLNLQFEELELAIQGYLNPFAKADVFVSSGGDNFEIEEASATILRGLPANLNIKVGQYLVDFGKLNQGHPHAWSFLDRPLVHRILLGDDGLKDVGIQVSTVIPLGNIYSKLSLNALSGRSMVCEGEDRGTEKPVGCGRYNVFLPVGEHGNIDAGISGIFGTYSKEASEAGGRNLKVTMGGLDLKYKYRPSDYTALILQGEAIFNRRDLRRNGELNHVTNYSGFAFVDYRFRKRYNAGVMVDYAPGIFDYSPEDTYETGPEEGNNTPLGRFDDQNSTVALTGFLGFALVEETTMVRLIGRYTTFNISDRSLLADPGLTEKRPQFLIAAQLQFAMGPHKPHDF